VDRGRRLKDWVFFVLVAEGLDIFCNYILNSVENKGSSLLPFRGMLSILRDSQIMSPTHQTSSSSSPASRILSFPHTGISSSSSKPSSSASSTASSPASPNHVTIYWPSAPASTLHQLGDPSTQDFDFDDLFNADSTTTIPSPASMAATTSPPLPSRRVQTSSTGQPRRRDWSTFSFSHYSRPQQRVPVQSSEKGSRGGGRTRATTSK
jgi:hypothetical protein